MPDADTTGTEAAEAITSIPAEVTPDPGTSTKSEDDPADTFPRKVVEDLRRENAGYRDRAKTAEARAEELSRALFAARIAETRKLADATDLEYDAELVDDAEALHAAVDALIEAKPHLKARSFGSVGQGQRGDSAEEFSLLDRLKGNP